MSEAVDTMRELAGRFALFSRSFGKGAPLYAQFAERVSNDPRILSLMSAAPPTQRIPVLLFAAVHYLLLREPAQPLARHYPNLDSEIGSSGSVPTNEPSEEFARFVLERSDDIAHLMRTRTVQTNEVGRCSWFVFPFAMLDEEVGPLARLDVGSSAGLTLLFPAITYVFRPGGSLGTSHDLVLNCDVRTGPPQPSTVPTVVWSVGVDPQPVDLHDEDAVRWLEACLWPDNLERIHRFRKAVGVARSRGIEVEAGDALSDIESLVHRARGHGHPVVTTSWVLNYLTPESRTAFVAELDRVGRAIDFSWVIAESPRETPELPVPTTGDEDITVLSLVTWRSGRRAVQRLGTAHPHGQWISWEYRAPNERNRAPVPAAG